MKNLGFVILDFPGQEVIDAIILSNFWNISKNKEKLDD